MVGQGLGLESSPDQARAWRKEREVEDKKGERVKEVNHRSKGNLHPVCM